MPRRKRSRTTPIASRTDIIGNLELLEIQAEGSLDGCGRLRGAYGVTIATTGDRHAMWIGADVPDAMARELMRAFEHASPAAPSEPPAALARCRQIFEAGGRAVEHQAGPSYLMRGAVQGVDPTLGAGVTIERSDAADSDTPVRRALRAGNPGNWHAVEWDELLDGHLGPWTIAVDNGVVASICHTPRPTSPRCAECGVWTRPGFRGHGYAAATTASWAAIMRPTGRHLFYSTDADNLSSQRVAQRLHLALIGWTWRLGASGDLDADPLHPLSRLRRGT